MPGRAFAGRALAFPAIAAAAAAVYFSLPTLMGTAGFGASVPALAVMAQHNAGPTRLAGTMAAHHAVLAQAASADPVVILRDPQIDEYLLAHQRFSPSLYSTAQFARSATFAADSGK